MKLIRYILSHAILLGFLVALGFAYYYRAQLFSQEVTTLIDRSVHKAMVMAKLAPEGSDPVSPAEPAVSSPTDDSQVAQETITEPVAQTEQLEAAGTPVDTSVVETSSEAGSGPVLSEQPQEQAVTESELTAEQNEVSETEMAKPESAESGDTEEAVKVEEVATETEKPEAQPEQVASVATEKEAADMAQPEQAESLSSDKEAVAKSHTELLNQARLAFQSGNSDKAVSLYKELSDLNPDDPNVYGELGNIFYSQGKWKQAGQAYYEAATRLLQKGQRGQVQYLHRVIQGLDQESAEKLRAQLGR